MSVFNFDFANRRENLTLVETKARAANNGCRKHSGFLPATDNASLTVSEGERFMRFVAKGARLERHYELFQLLQCEEIQHFIPHQILISAWCDDGEPKLNFDVVSAIPGVRTGLLNCGAIEGLIKDLYKRWLLHGRRPLLFASATDTQLAHSTCDCALHKYLRGSWSLLVHGVIDARDKSDSLYLALNTNSVVNGQSIEHFRLLADMLITQIDVAFRKIAALKVTSVPTNQGYTAIVEVLSAREEEVLRWVSVGKTNDEIAQILDISVNTVKNHLQQIMRKLNAANRTEAVAKHRQSALQAAEKKAARENTLHRMTPRFAWQF